MMNRFLATAMMLLALLMLPGQVSAQDNPLYQKIQALDWQRSPALGAIAGKAAIRLDGGLRFLDAHNTTQYLTLLGNLPQTDSFTVAANDLRWFSVFTFMAEGYVKDDETIDPDALLATLKQNNVQSQPERKQRGLPALYLEGWFIAPRYDSQTKRLEWATLLRDDAGQNSVNFSTNLLGRSGHMNVILVSDPQNLASDMVQFKTALGQFEFVSGERYSEWRQGDKIAEYGLSALVVGGAAAVATKKGLWAALGGFIAAAWKILAGLAIAIGAGLKSLFKSKSTP